MKRVVKKIEPTSIVHISNINKVKYYYVLETDVELYTLKRCNPIGGSGKKWAWVHLIDPELVYCVTPSPVETIEFGMNTGGSVYQIEDFSDLVEFLKDREEKYIGKI